MVDQWTQRNNKNHLPTCLDVFDKKITCPTVLYCTLLYFTVIYCTLLYFIVLHCTLLYFTVLYCTLPYCTVLYCIILYCTLLYYKDNVSPDVDTTIVSRVWTDDKLEHLSRLNGERLTTDKSSLAITKIEDSLVYTKFSWNLK